MTRKPHPLFKVRDNQMDLDIDLKIDFYTALLGGEVLVPTLTGDVKLRIAEGTQSGRLLRISKRGLPELHEPEILGDLYARVLIQIPTELSLTERDTFRDLAALRGVKSP